MASVYDEASLKKAQEDAQKAVQKQVAINLKGVSDATKQQLQNYQTYTPSQAVTAAQQTYQATQAAKPQEYVSPYDEQIKAAYDKIMNRSDFKYDLNSDMLYQQYKDQYVNQGRRAMMDTMGQAAALTGGYGSSYASTAGNQAYQNYLQQLNAVIPELYDRAYNQYSLEGENLLDRYNMALGADEQAYGRWNDAYARWANELAAAENTFNTERNFDYGSWQNNLAYWQNLAQTELDNYWREQSMAGGGGGGRSGGGRSGGSGEDEEVLLPALAWAAKAAYDEGGFDAYAEMMRQFSDGQKAVDPTTGETLSQSALMAALTNDPYIDYVTRQEAARRKEEQEEQKKRQDDNLQTILDRIKNPKK